MKLNRQKLRKMILTEIYNLNEEVNKKEDGVTHINVLEALRSISAPAAAAYMLSEDVRVFVNGKLVEAGESVDAGVDAIKSALKQAEAAIIKYAKTQKDALMAGLGELF